MHILRASWITLFLAACNTQPSAPEAPPATPPGLSTAAAAGSSAQAGAVSEQRKPGKPEIRYYVIGDA